MATVILLLLVVIIVCSVCGSMPKDDKVLELLYSDEDENEVSADDSESEEQLESATTSEEAVDSSKTEKVEEPKQYKKPTKAVEASAQAMQDAEELMQQIYKEG